MHWDEIQNKTKNAFPKGSKVRLANTEEVGVVTRTSAHMVFVKIEGVGERGFFPKDVELVEEE